MKGFLFVWSLWCGGVGGLVTGYITGRFILDRLPKKTSEPKPPPIVPQPKPAGLGRNSKSSGSERVRELLPTIGIDVQSSVGTPDGEFDRIEVSADNGMPVPAEVILHLAGLGEPLSEGCGKRVTIVHELPGGVVILSRSEPRHTDSHAANNGKSDVIRQHLLRQQDDLIVKKCAEITRQRLAQRRRPGLLARLRRLWKGGSK